MPRETPLRDATKDANVQATCDSSTCVTDVTLSGMCNNVNVIAFKPNIQAAFAPLADALVSSSIVI